MRSSLQSLYVLQGAPSQWPAQEQPGVGLGSSAHLPLTQMRSSLQSLYVLQGAPSQWPAQLHLAAGEGVGAGLGAAAPLGSSVAARVLPSLSVSVTGQPDAEQIEGSVRPAPLAVTRKVLHWGSCQEMGRAGPQGAQG